MPKERREKIEERSQEILLGMALPDFNDKGDFPEGVHPATINEVIARFVMGTPQR